MFLKAAIVCCLIATILCAEDTKAKKKDPRGKRNLEYSLSHHPHHPNYRLERRIAVGQQLNRYPPFFPPRTGGGNIYRKGRPSVPAPPYAVNMEPLMQYSQRDPLYDPNLLHIPTLNQNDLVKTEDLQTDNNHVSENVYGVPKHVIERPVYIKEPEPIIEIIIRESNVTLPPAPVQSVTPTPKKKEQVQVFYVKYKKNPHGKGKDSIVYDKPVAAISPQIKDEEEVIQQPEYQPQEYVTSAPPPSTTLRAIIKPESETYHAHKGIHITFGQEQKREHDDQDEESAPQPSVSLPHEHRIPVEGNFRSERQRVPQGYTPFGPPPPPPQFSPPQFGRKIPPQSFPHPPPQQHQIPRTPPFNQPLPNFNRPSFQNYNYFKQQSQVLIAPNNYRQPVPYQPFDQIRPPTNERFPIPKPHPHFPVRPQPPVNQPPQQFASNHPSPPRPFDGPPSVGQFENGFGQQLPSQNNFNHFKQQDVQFPPNGEQHQQFHQNQEKKNFNHFKQPDVQFPPNVEQHQQFHQNQESFKHGEQQDFGPQFNQNKFNHGGEQPNPEQVKFGHDQYKIQHEQIHQYQQQQIKQQQEKIKEQLHENQFHAQQYQQQQNLQYQQQQQNQQQPQQLIPPGGELIQSVPKYEQHYSVNSNGQYQKIQFNPNHQPQNENQQLPQSQALQQPQPSQSVHQPTKQDFLNPDQFKQQVQKQFQPPQQQLQHPQQQFQQSQQNKAKSVEVQTKQNEQFLRQFQAQYALQTQHSQQQQQLNQQHRDLNQQQNQPSFAELQFQQLLANQPRGPAYVSSTQAPSTTERIQYKSTTQAITTSKRPETTTKDIKELNLQLPDEVPDDLREQLLSSGILNNADISVLDYDKVGDIPLSALPPDQLANFYGAGGASQIASGSAPVPAIVRPDDDQSPSASATQEVKVQPPKGVEMKVVRYNPDSEEGKKVQKTYIKEDSKQTEPVELNVPTYNRYLPLKVSGAQFPIPDIPELKGRAINSVVVLAPIDYEFQEKTRVTRDANLDGIEFPKGSALKNLLDNPSRENYIKFLDHENKTATDQQSVILLVTGSPEKDREIFMYDIATKSVSKLSGELSSAFVDAADANTNDSTGAASNLVEVRVPSPKDLTIDRSDDISFDLEGEPSEMIESKIPVIDPMETDLESEASETLEHFVDVSGQDLSMSDVENDVKIESGYSKTGYSMPLH